MEDAPTPFTSKPINELEGPIENLKKFEAIYNENKKLEISIYKRGIHLIVEMI